ncbi:MAG: chromosomal replication initiator protein DnaA [Candidatus Omnitrophica bacterium]|nr:chromosomal replication initiator protein DnaA [Candidatus Omnitrophota bacterium]
MTHPDSSLWQKALAQIQRELPSQAYETWFEPTRAVFTGTNSLVIEVPSVFFRDWIVSHYSELIGRVLGGLSPAKVKVEFAVASRVQAPATSTGAPGAGASPTPAAGPSVGLAEQPARHEPGEGALNTRYTFDQFVIGSSNRFAHAAAMAVSDSPAKVYNPLFIYGGVGLGKTHLMQAIGHRMRERSPRAKCLYLTSERFTNQLISAIQNRSMAAFRDRFRTADVLMVDDVHFMGGKEATQEGFFHTFNALYDAHKQIVISSDRQPKELHGLEERLVSRFEWGLVTDVHPPDLETRAAILRKKALAQGQEVPEEVTLFIAQQITSNIRELEGALNRVTAYGLLEGQAITLPMAREVLRGVMVETAKEVTVEKILQVVADHFSLSVADLKGKRRTQKVSFPRQLAMALARELTESSLPAVGEFFGGRDHTTVLYACQKLEQVRKKDGKVGRIYESLLVELGKSCG